MGYAAATVEYRFITEVGLEEIVGDVARACAYLRGIAVEYGFDGDRMCMMGSSAGANLSLVFGARAGEFARVACAAICRPSPVSWPSAR